MSTLAPYILPKGAITAWNKSFKAGARRWMAHRMPAHGPTIDRMSSMSDDLKDVFHKQYYVHPEFKARDVLPALLPNLRYKELSIHGGAQASDACWKMVSSTTASETEMIANDLKNITGSIPTLCMRFGGTSTSGEVGSIK